MYTHRKKRERYITTTPIIGHHRENIYLTNIRYVKMIGLWTQIF